MVTQVSRFMYRTPVPGYPPISKIGYSSHFLRLNRAARDWVSRSVAVLSRTTAANCVSQRQTPAAQVLNSYFPWALPAALLCPVNVAYWHKADIPTGSINV